jgi:hypothetical protein
MGTPCRQTMTKVFFLLSGFCVEVSSQRIDSASLCDEASKLNIRNKIFVIVTAVNLVLSSAGLQTGHRDPTQSVAHEAGRNACKA